MKYIIYYTILTGLIFSCNTKAQEIKNIPTVQLGGKDLHGDLYRKKYPKPDDSNISYKKWTGYEVSSNKELEQILKIAPNCEALRFSYWDHDTINNFELTKKIGEFTKLKFLEIHTNRVKTYPKEIENLSKLEEIIFQVSQKETIEIDFSKFKILQHLTIHFADNIKQFPYSIFECKNLETLKLFRFFLYEGNLLSGVEKLTKLKELYIWDSNLTLPQEAKYNFKDLETLIIDRMRTPLPEYFYNNLSIKRLALSSMFDTLNLTKLSMMKNLESVSLSYQNELTGKLVLPKLENLYIADYHGEKINIEFNKLKSLNSLTIWGCPNLLSTSKISGEQLKSIVLVNNPKLKELNYHPNKLNKLEEVILRSNESLENRPQKISNVSVKETETNRVDGPTNRS